MYGHGFCFVCIVFLELAHVGVYRKTRVPTRGMNQSEQILLTSLAVQEICCQQIRSEQKHKPTSTLLNLSEQLRTMF